MLTICCRFIVTRKHDLRKKQLKNTSKIEIEPQRTNREN